MGSEDLGLGIPYGSELGLVQALGLEDLFANQEEGVHGVPLDRQPRSLLPGHASREGMNVLKA